MNNQVLLSHVAIGPTFRDRLLFNILDNLDSYLLFDNLILTDIKEDFKQLEQYPNIKIEYVDDIRKDYPWSLNYEPLPIKTNNEEEYASFIMDNEFSIPSGLFRFVLKYAQYKAIVFLNCDVVLNITLNEFNTFHNEIDKLTTDTVIGRNHFFFNHFHKERDFISKKYNIPIKNPSLESNDGNLFMYVFKDKNKQKNFIDLYNKITYLILADNPKELSKLGKHGSWLINSEAIQSLTHSFLDIQVFPTNHIMNDIFKIETYPEDRFWNWPQGGFKCNKISKKLFIEENKESLKEFYTHRGQTWTYE